MAFVAAGSLAARSGNETTLGVVAPTFTEDTGDQVMFAAIISNNTGTTFTDPDGDGWVEIAFSSYDPAPSGRAHRCGLYYRLVDATDSGETFTFGNMTAFTLSAGVIWVMSGVNRSDILDDTTCAEANQDNSATYDTNVVMPAYDPTSSAGQIMYVAFYAEDNTDFSTAPTGGPSLTVRINEETATGTDASIAMAEGAHDGSSYSAINWAHNATLDGAATAMVFAVNNEAAGGSVVPIIVQHNE